ncbi:hypothetical protein BDB00DRAFT_812472 [Zychaea mexicana]|uniref:uncharacterized protein n=1 Tax=Zychaea mexicana TaxID=64656 RepID=UPI0022FDEFBA|nr:uncharacterized protein BDB00DRAFT_812472 [Zychaea mexicana]KAI9495895.1 hypothetical protein BDB00DRAFT_812472 [Zychaea mexicana]
MQAWLQWIHTNWHDPHHSSTLQPSLSTYRHISTIDFILFSSTFAATAGQAEHQYVAHRGHAAVAASIAPGLQITGPGLWRFNPTFLHNPQFLDDRKRTAKRL